MGGHSLVACREGWLANLPRGLYFLLVFQSFVRLINRYPVILEQLAETRSISRV
jgi:hypothetical protein